MSIHSLIPFNARNYVKIYQKLPHSLFSRSLNVSLLTTGFDKFASCKESLQCSECSMYSSSEELRGRLELFVSVFRFVLRHTCQDPSVQAHATQYLLPSLTLYVRVTVTNMCRYNTLIQWPNNRIVLFYLQTIQLQNWSVCSQQELYTF